MRDPIILHPLQTSHFHLFESFAHLLALYYTSLMADEVCTFLNIGHFVSKNYFSYICTYIHTHIYVYRLVQIPLIIKNIKFCFYSSNSRKIVIFFWYPNFLSECICCLIYIYLNVF